MKNRSIVLRARPRGIPQSSDFELVETEVPEIRRGQVLLRHRYLGLAPAARLRIGEMRTYAAPLALGAPMYGQVVGEVVASAADALAAGDLVVMTAGSWQDYSVVDAASVSKIQTDAFPPTAWLGILGISGYTAYVGMLKLAQAKAGETVVVSAAAGAVGSAAAQIAQLSGCRVTGIAGGAEKCAFAKDTFGIAECVDYRCVDFPERLRDACSTGADVYFDNVGGAVRDVAMGVMRRFGRITVCGMISEYNDEEYQAGPSWFPLLFKRLTVQGFLIHDHPQYQDEFVRSMRGWHEQGGLKLREDITTGLENAPAAFIRMLSGKNFGKTIVALD